MRFHLSPFAGESVPGTDREAVVTAEDAIANGRPELDRNRAFEFDGKIGNAAARVELEWRDDGGGRARGDAPSAGAAAVLFRCVRLQFKRGEDFAQEDPIA